jgi:hypothetical protein
MKRFAIFALLVPLFAACVQRYEYSLDFDRETFDRERQLWLEQGFANYSYHLVFQRYNWGDDDASGLYPVG